LLNLSALNRQEQQLLRVNLRILGLTLEEDGEIVDSVVDIVEALIKAITDIMVDLLVVLKGVQVLLGVLIKLITDIMDLTDLMELTDLLEVTGLMVVLIMAEEESGVTMLRNVKNKRCSLQRKSR
jgi:hypothetical protein